MTALEIAAEAAAWLVSDGADTARQALAAGDRDEAIRLLDRAMMDAARAVSLLRIA